MINVNITVNLPIKLVWDYWTNPNHIVNWNNPDENWFNAKVEIDFKEGGQFLYRMQSKEGKEGFDHGGVFDLIKPQELIKYTLNDGRKSEIKFITKGDSVEIIESFDPEEETPLEIQKQFCLSVLEMFKKYAESN